MEIATFILIGIAVGWTARVLLERKGMGLWLSIGVGAAGGLLGGIVFEVIVRIVQALVPAIAALLGAIVAVMAGGQIMRKRRKSLP